VVSIRIETACVRRRVQETLSKSMSKKIMDTAKEQMEEMEAEEMGRYGLLCSLRRTLLPPA
jgi:hypothetical protein